jgi:hypothetical protein
MFQDVTSMLLDHKVIPGAAELFHWLQRLDLPLGPELSWSVMKGDAPATEGRLRPAVLR